QVCGAVQVPQESMPPHPSGTIPQFLPRPTQVAGVQPHTLAAPPPPQVCGAVQAPQFNMPPHPSPIEPQFLPAATQVVGVQIAMPHTLLVHIWPIGQVPHATVPPHPSEIEPQFFI